MNIKIMRFIALQIMHINHENVKMFISTLM